MKMRFRAHTMVLFAALTAFVSGSAQAKARHPTPSNTLRDYSLTEGKEVEIRARPVRYPAYVYGDRAGRKSLFVASGFMGDAQALSALRSTVETSAAVEGEPGRTALRVRYKPVGQNGWAGLYWLTPANNWGKIKGAGFDLHLSTALTFWVRGETGGETISSIKIGGVNGPYPDTDAIDFGPIEATKDWTQYTIPLEEKDLRHIVGGFGIIVRRSDNPRGAVFYLDEVVYHGPIEEDEGPGERRTTSGPIVEEAAEPGVHKDDPTQLGEPVNWVVRFESARRGFSPQALNALNEVVAMANRYPKALIYLEGHTDNVGSASINMRLSIERAQTVASFLGEAGIEGRRIDVQGYGQERPIASNQSKSGRELNRRVEIVLREL